MPIIHGSPVPIPLLYTTTISSLRIKSLGPRKSVCVDGFWSSVVSSVPPRLSTDLRMASRLVYWEHIGSWDRRRNRGLKMYVFDGPREL